MARAEPRWSSVAAWTSGCLDDRRDGEDQRREWYIRILSRSEIDLASVAAVEEEILAAIPDQPTAVSVDLTELTYMDSVGIRILFNLASQLLALRIVLERL